MSQVERMPLALGLLLAAMLCGCVGNDTGKDNAEAQGQAIDSEMGCPGFDPKFVPTDYLDMKPCLEQLRWTVHFKVAEERDLRTDTGTADSQEDFDLEATGEQLVWRWEENGTRDGHYSFVGRDNTDDEMIVRQQGNARYTGSLKSVDTGSGPGTMTEDASLSGSANGTQLSDMALRDDGRLCLLFDLDARMRGRIASTVEKDGMVVHPEEPLILAGMLAKDGDAWNLDDELASQEACTGPAKAEDMEQYDGSQWSGLKADEKKGAWSLKDSKLISIAGLPHELRYTVELQVNRVTLDAKLPLPPK